MQLNHFLYGLIVGALATLTSGVSATEKTKKEHYKDAMALVPVVKVPAAPIRQELNSGKARAFQIVLVDDVTIGNSCFEAVPKDNKCLEAINKKKYVKAKNCDVYNAAQLWVLKANNKICLKTNSKTKCLAPFSDKNQKKLKLSPQEDGFSWVYDLLTSTIYTTLGNQDVFLGMNPANNKVILKDSFTSFHREWFLDYWFEKEEPTLSPTSSPSSPKPTVKEYSAFESYIDLKDAVVRYCDTPQEDETYGPIANWDVSQITDMFILFKDKDDCNPSIEQWNVSNVKNFTFMFASSDFNQNISTWDVSKGVHFDHMFYDAASFNQNLCPWNNLNDNVSSAPHFCNGPISCGTCSN